MAGNTRELKPEELRRTCDPKELAFGSTEELPPLERTVGQDRALRAIEFGVSIRSHGYNIFAMGPSGTGKASFIRSFLRDRAGKMPVPDDWCYVYNQADPYRPNAIRLPAGKGQEFKRDVDQLVERLRVEIPRALESEACERERTGIVHQVEEQRTVHLTALQQEAAQAGFTLRASPAGLALVPAAGEPLGPEQLQQLELAQTQELERQSVLLREQIASTMRRVREIEKEAEARIVRLEQESVVFAVGHFIDDLKGKYADLAEIPSFLDIVRKDVIESVPEFRRERQDPQQPPQPRAASSLQDRYRVNLIVDNSGVRGAPVIMESNPTFPALLGRIDRQVRQGMLVTDFSMIKAGALHRANGGFLILEAESVLRNPLAWEGLKRAIEGRQARISDVAQEASVFATVSVEPEPIPLDLKIILIGSAEIYYYLYANDQDFQKQFKVQADFDSQMDRTAETMHEYARFICARCAEEKLLPFDASSVAKVIEYGSELVGDRDKLSSRFIDIVDIVREASFWAVRGGRQRVLAEDVKQAVWERTHRANRMEKRLQELVTQDVIMVDTVGTVVGQVNGLAVLRLGDYAFGKPARITARTFLGSEGVINIEREVKMSGPTHDKGVLILAGYLRGTYAQDVPISLGASICFEQSYEGVDGDSASSTELYALLSSISGLPIRQSIAVTGSVNQRGEIQPIGGASEKIAGFFDVCAARGLTGDQGVMIPARNVRNLMLRDDVVEAVARAAFHIYPVATIDDGIEILTGVEGGPRRADGGYPDGTVNHLVASRLREMAERLRTYRDGTGVRTTAPTEA